MSFLITDDSQQTSLISVNAAKFIFNDKINEFHEAIKFLNKLSDIVQFIFGDGYLSVEAVAVAKSACGYIYFSGNCLAEYNLGDMHNVTDSDKHVQVSSKDLLSAMRHIREGDTLTVAFGIGRTGDNCTLQYVNTREILRCFDLCSRDVPVTYKREDWEVDDYRNVIVLPATKLNNIFKQFKDTDEIFIEATGEQFGLSTHIDEKDRGRVASTVTALAPEAMDRYEILAPMSLIVSAREIRSAFKLLNNYAHLIVMAFDMGNKPMLVTIDDEHSNLKAQITLSIAGAKEYGESANASQVTSEPTVSSVQPGANTATSKTVAANKSRRLSTSRPLRKRPSMQNAKENECPPPKQTQAIRSHESVPEPQSSHSNHNDDNYFDFEGINQQPGPSQSHNDPSGFDAADPEPVQAPAEQSKEFNFFSQPDDAPADDGDQGFPDFNDQLVDYHAASYPAPPPPPPPQPHSLLIEVLQDLGLETLSLTGADIPCADLPPAESGNIYAAETQCNYPAYEYPYYGYHP
uniref:DNA repair protein RAD9 n=1 Tax=Panagrellus redivivus TaxID=6233 RepID=A0A7E4ZVS8_PANRE